MKGSRRVVVINQGIIDGPDQRRPVPKTKLPSLPGSTNTMAFARPLTNRRVE